MVPKIDIIDGLNHVKRHKTHLVRAWCPPTPPGAKMRNGRGTRTCSPLVSLYLERATRVDVNYTLNGPKRWQTHLDMTCCPPTPCLKRKREIAMEHVSA